MQNRENIAEKKLLLLYSNYKWALVEQLYAHLKISSVFCLGVLNGN